MPPPRMHANQLDIDGTLVRRLVDGQFPEYAALPLRHVPSGGTENAVNPAMVTTARRGIEAVLSDAA